MEPKVRVIKENEVALVTLNRPEVYNALDEEMLKLLAEHMADRRGSQVYSCLRRGYG
jgi:enoyl-CoA hydratase/carnithine racemase